MGYRSKEVTGTVGYTLQSFGGALVPGTLVTATLQARTPNVNCVQAYARLIITEASQDPGSMVAQLSSGYFGYANPLFWHGTIPVGSEHFVVAAINAPGVVRYRLTWWTVDKETASRGLPRDP